MGTVIRNFRIYGNKPFHVAVVHGGPGMPGEMAPVARELSAARGILEPLQTAVSLEGQVEELHTVLGENGEFPVILIGWSWGAWLSYIFSARYASLVEKLILIGSGAYQEKYAVDILQTRLGRLSREERAEVLCLMEIWNNPAIGDRGAFIARFGELMYKADSFDPLPYSSEVLEYQHDIFRNVWEQASEMRRSGRLLELGKKIRCPVVAIHGDYDPHLAEGTREPLSRVLKDFRFILLEKCGHYPWRERAARGRFFEILKNEIRW